MKKSSLPASLRSYFWDVDASKINPSTKYSFIIQRLLDKGNDKAVKWVRSYYTDEQIKGTLTKFRDFSPKVANFWALFFNISKDKIPCLQTPYLQKRRQHWPY